MKTLAAMVRVRGPDPKLVKAAGTAFHQAEDGITVSSASGMRCQPSLTSTAMLMASVFRSSPCC